MSARAVVLALGSNIEPRLTFLRRGVSSLIRVVRVARVSSVWETDPVDSPAGSGRYLNMTVTGVTDLTPPELLEACLDIERRAGRRSSIRNAPRRLDVDIIWMDGIDRTSGNPVVPHPRFRQRAFILEPLKEIGFDRFDARSGRMLRQLSGDGAVERVARLW